MVELSALFLLAAAFTAAAMRALASGDMGFLTPVDVFLGIS
jgi:hypothetical protein